VPVELTLKPEQRGVLSVLSPSRVSASSNVDAIITDRFGGVSHAPYDSLNLASHVGDHREDVEANRRRVATAIGVDLAHLITLSQVHGTDVLDVETNEIKLEGDGLVTSTSGLALAILVADCVPVLLIDDSSPRFGVVHAAGVGWPPASLRAPSLTSTTRAPSTPSLVRASQWRVTKSVPKSRRTSRRIESLSLPTSKIDRVWTSAASPCASCLS